LEKGHEKRGWVLGLFWGGFENRGDKFDKGGDGIEKKVSSGGKTSRHEEKVGVWGQKKREFSVHFLTTEGYSEVCVCGENLVKEGLRVSPGGR